MKNLLFIFFLFIGYTGYSQTYKIAITYDANGNRIKRERICIAGCSHTIDAKINLDLSVRVYPNPTSMTCNIDVPLEWINDTNPCKVAVMDITGRQVLSQTLNKRYNTVDMGAFADGTYLFTISAGSEQRHVEKIVKATR